MANEIINRVANSKLVTIDLEDFYPEGERTIIDIAQWLTEGFILREKDFRAFVKEHSWEQYTNQYVAIKCSTDAIVPGWAYMLVSVALAPYAKKVVVGTIDTLNNLIFSEIIAHLDLDIYKDKSVIVKGCAHKPIPQNAFVLLTQRLQPIVKSLMYGEACSSVPLYKKPSTT
jgi:hypothetical protein